jgi:hypothetical protein
MRDDAAMSSGALERAVAGVARRWSPARSVVAFAAAVSVFHHLPTTAGIVRLHNATDLLTPLAVVGSALAALLTLRAPPRALAVGFAAAVVYTDGHGIHLSANAIRDWPLSGRAADSAHFWDETFGHLWWHLGWFGLVAAICLADPRSRAELDRVQTGAIVLLLGATLFTNTVEGGDWWLELAAAAVFCAWAAAARRPVVTAFAGAFGFAAALIGVWALWHGGVPQFSELGWLPG